MSRFMDYGPDWPPPPPEPGFSRAVRREMRRIRQSRPRPYGYDSARRQQVRQDTRKAATRRPRHLATIIALVALAVVIIGWDREARHINLDRPASPIQGRTTDVTTTLPPHPANTQRHP